MHRSMVTGDVGGSVREREHRQPETVLSLADLFIVGVTFDVLGGYYLARGLLAQPRDIARRTASLFGGNPETPASQVAAGADARIGLVSLTIGFALQAGGYVADVAGATVATGFAETIFAVAIAAAAVLAALVAARPIYRRKVRGLAIGVARLDSATGELVALPDHNVLVQLADALGFSIEGIETRHDPGWASAGGPAA